MDAMLQPDNEGIASQAAALGALLKEHNGGDVAVLDLRDLNTWTDFFVIATVTSNAHLRGLQRHIKEFAGQEGIEILHRRKRIGVDEQWTLIDLGFIVIHLMSAQARAFYELERLWNAAPLTGGE